MNAKRIALVLVALLFASALFANGGSEPVVYDVVFSSSLLEMEPQKVLKVNPTQAILDKFLDEGVTEACLAAAPQDLCRADAEQIREVIEAEGAGLADDIIDVLMDAYKANDVDFVYMIIGLNSWNVHTAGKGNFDVAANEFVVVAQK